MAFSAATVQNVEYYVNHAELITWMTLTHPFLTNVKLQDQLHVRFIN